ncbi:MAG TPA: hypothetical protein VMU81_27040 [Acetobacteraceae bacterium]|nr:hypothetical protein [Acetobacteraceae bacterium]
MAMRVILPMTLIGAALALTGCATPQQQAQHRENMLAAAGFVQHPADTPQRQQSLRTLPPDKVVRTVHGNQVVYVLADPTMCDCLYIGNQQNWGNYQREMLQLHIANEEEIAAENWDLGPWGPGWWY